MDFKSLVNKINSLNDEVKTIAAPELPKAVQLNEDAELRVLAGTSTYIAEAKKKAEEKKEDKKEVEEGFDSDSKVGDTFKTAKGTATKTATGVKHTRDKYDYDPGSDDKDDKKRKEKARSAKKESVDPEQFKAKFTKMVEAKKEEKKDDKKKKPMKEAAKPDFLDIDKDGDKKEPMKKAAADKGGDKKDGKKGMSAKQEKYFGKKNESVKTSKKVVAESVEGSLSLKDMLKIVKESGGQQAIDPVDQTLWQWANRVASAKINESQKAEIFAAMIYERNGGRFEMYDVLAEDQK